MDNEVEKTALHSSHAIVAARYQKEWMPKPLLDVSKWNRDNCKFSVATR